MLTKLPKAAAAKLNTDPYFAHVFLRIKNKDMAIVPFVYNRAQKHYERRRTARDIILKSRQLGFSTKIQGQEAHATMFGTASALTIADTMDNTLKLRMIYNRFYEQWPEEYLPLRPPRAQDSAVVVTYPTTNSESWIMTAGSRSAGKASTYSHIHFSEMAFYGDATNVFATTMQAATPKAQVVIESTPNGAQGLFYELCMKALDGDKDWRLHFYPWWWGEEYQLPLEDGETLIYSEDELEAIDLAAQGGFQLAPEQINWRRAKQRELITPGAFFQQYPESIHGAFIHSGFSVFGDISGNLQAPSIDKPVEGHRYVAGADWGQANDFSAISIIDATDNTEVHIDHFNRMAWNDMQERMVLACLKWGVETFQPESNSIGSVNIAGLRDKFASRDYRINLRPVETTNLKKRRWVTNLYQGLHNDGLQLLNRDYATAELRAFTQRQTAQGAYVYEAASSAHDDTVIARMLAYDAACKLIS